MNNLYLEILMGSCDLMECYEKDLFFHDKNWFDQWSGGSFIHATRAHGTHVYSLDDGLLPEHGVRVKFLFGHSDREHIARQPLECIQYHNSTTSDNVLRWMYYNALNDTLTQITGAKAESLALHFLMEVQEEKRELEKIA